MHDLGAGWLLDVKGGADSQPPQLLSDAGTELVTGGRELEETGPATSKLAYTRAAAQEEADDGVGLAASRIRKRGSSAGTPTSASIATVSPS